MMTALESCKYLFSQAKERVAEAMPLLHQIFKEGLWQSEYNSFGEYVCAGSVEGRKSRSGFYTLW